MIIKIHNRIVQFGIVSKSDYCPDAVFNWPTIATGVKAYKNWINGKLNMTIIYR